MQGLKEMAAAARIAVISPDETLETCARQIIVTYFHQMMSYKDGAKAGRDIEFVHDMRVTSRRLRVTMDNFADCFPKKPFRKHYKKVKAITRTLGAVRDLDVLIHRFQKILDTLSETEQADIRELISHLQREREEARKPMLTLFRKLEETGFERKFLTFFQGFDRISRVEPLCSYRENARIILPQKVEEVDAWEPFIRDAARHEELHNMRISIKRLRYTMEIFRSVYQHPKKGTKAAAVMADKRFAEFFAVILDLQEILGDIHDCDVVLQVLTDYTHQSASDTVAPASPPVTGKAGIAKLIARTREVRKADYEKFLEKWEQLSAADFKGKLLSFLVT